MPMRYVHDAPHKKIQLRRRDAYRLFSEPRYSIHYRCVYCVDNVSETCCTNGNETSMRYRVPALSQHKCIIEVEISATMRENRRRRKKKRRTRLCGAAWKNVICCSESELCYSRENCSIYDPAIVTNIRGVYLELPKSTVGFHLNRK